MELRPKQSQAANALPVRFGTGFIFQPFAATAAIERNQRQTKLVVCPLQSVIIDY